ncbi:FAD-dependent oxidoreductase [Pseudonocardia sp. NPDC049635]|uniref:NAD(P)/FAD-dependent oxidoreductase n=1 Tax=Pseudonocardia sp. NPDC049635 TaxID=3155506 RepID=UPI0033FDBA5C
MVGASVAGVRVVQALRSSGHDSPVVLVDRENGAPYDKPALSKEVLTSPGTDPSVLLDDAGLRDLDVDLRVGTTITGIAPATRQLESSDGERIAFGALVVATGSAPRRIPLLDAFTGVHYLRTRADAEAIRAAFAQRPRVVVVGGGFVGLEVASSARSLGLEVTVVEAAHRPAGRVLPAAVADHLAALHREHSVRLLCGRTVVGGLGSTRIEGLELDDGTRLPADLVVVGIGTAPVTDWLGGGVPTTGDGVHCDPGLAVHGLSRTWAVGDVAAWPDAETGHPRRTEHWTTAREQAAYVAKVIAGGQVSEPFRTTGYVWSDQHGTRIQHVGRAGPGTVTRSEPTDTGRLFVHCRGDEVTGATAFDAPRELLAVRRLLTTGNREVAR